MTRDGDFKKKVRARMDATGESFTAARFRLLAQPPPRGARSRGGPGPIPGAVQILAQFRGRVVDSRRLVLAILPADESDARLLETLSVWTRQGDCAFLSDGTTLITSFASEEELVRRDLGPARQRGERELAIPASMREVGIEAVDDPAVLSFRMWMDRLGSALDQAIDEDPERVAAASEIPAGWTERELDTLATLAAADGDPGVLLDPARLKLLQEKANLADAARERLVEELHAGVLVPISSPGVHRGQLALVHTRQPRRPVSAETFDIRTQLAAASPGSDERHDLQSLLAAIRDIDSLDHCPLVPDLDVVTGLRSVLQAADVDSWLAGNIETGRLEVLFIIDKVGDDRGIRPAWRHLRDQLGGRMADIDIRPVTPEAARMLGVIGYRLTVRQAALRSMGGFVHSLGDAIQQVMDENGEREAAPTELAELLAIFRSGSVLVPHIDRAWSADPLLHAKVAMQGVPPSLLVFSSHARLTAWAKGQPAEAYDILSGAAVLQAFARGAGLVDLVIDAGSAEAVRIPGRALAAMSAAQPSAGTTS
jgi:hypothetical protein